MWLLSNNTTCNTAHFVWGPIYGVGQANLALEAHSFWLSNYIM